LLRPYAHELVGVDLSGGMLAQARSRAVYDTLEQAELGAWLDVPRLPFELLVSADTLCYFGAIDRLLVALRRACTRGGWLVFTVEALDDADQAGFRLQHHGRYAHQGEAVRRALLAAGWQSAELESVVLRQEAGQPVRGWLVSAQAAGDSTPA
jgi:predicted TPR repeat methyltransferase